MKRLPSLRLLIGFEAAARLGSYSRAADELCLSQSAISHQIAQLEKQLGQSLFRRIGRGVELTMAGNSLLQTVSQSLELIGNGLERINTYLNPGLVVIVCPAAIAQGWLLPHLHALQEKLPGLCPLVSIDESARYVDEIDVDISISYRPLQQQNVVEQEFLCNPMACVAGTKLAEALNAYTPDTHHQQAKLLGLEQDILSASNSEIYRSHFSAWRQSALFDDLRLLVASVVQNQGVAYVPLLAADDAISRHTIKILPDYPSLILEPLWISRQRCESRSPLIEQLFNQLIEMAGTYNSVYA
jgi:LysR family transcriptional regulator, glycine cleavage system transcriptional activator